MSAAVDWPATSVETIPPKRFRPAFCPRPSCSEHQRQTSRGFRYQRYGFFSRLCDKRRVPRFLCLTCRHTFSQQTFAFSYYLKRPEISAPIAAGLVAGSAHRQLGRSLCCAPSSVTHRSARLGRHSLLLLACARASLAGLDEPVLLDDFETFAGSQFFPAGISTATGQRSWFIYALDSSPHRRSGRLTPAQRRIKAELEGRHGRPARGAYTRSFARQLDRLVACARGRTVTAVSDALQAYATALRRHPERARVRHLVYPNPRRGPRGSPRSAYARERDRAMWPNDALHALIRHSAVHHRRETIAFGRRLNSVMERAYLLAVWRNLVKRQSERQRGPGRSPAMAVGLTDAMWSWDRVLARRLQPSRVALDPQEMRIYRREIVTPLPAGNLAHSLRLAF